MGRLTDSDHSTLVLYQSGIIARRSAHCVHLNVSLVVSQDVWSHHLIGLDRSPPVHRRLHCRTHQSRLAYIV